MTDTPDPAEAARCRALWAEVAQLAIEDAEAKGGGALGYLLSDDFQTVLGLAGIDPDAARDVARREHRRIRLLRQAARAAA